MDLRKEMLMRREREGEVDDMDHKVFASYQCSLSMRVEREIQRELPFFTL